MFGDEPASVYRSAGCDASLFALHSKKVGEGYVITVGKRHKTGKWCIGLDDDGSTSRCIGVPSGPNHARLQAYVVSEITREQLGAHAGVIEARADSRKRQLEKRSKQRVNVGGLGRASEGGEEEEEEEGERPESARHVQGKSTRWEHASCAAEIEAARGGMAFFSLRNRRAAWRGGEWRGTRDRGELQGGDIHLYLARDARPIVQEC